MRVRFETLDGHKFCSYWTLQSVCPARLGRPLHGKPPYMHTAPGDSSAYSSMDVIEPAPKSHEKRKSRLPIGYLRPSRTAKATAAHGACTQWRHTVFATATRNSKEKGTVAFEESASSVSTIASQSDSHTQSNKASRAGPLSLPVTYSEVQKLLQSHSHVHAALLLFFCVCVPSPPSSV